MSRSRVLIQLYLTGQTAKRVPRRATKVNYGLNTYISFVPVYKPYLPRSVIQFILRKNLSDNNIEVCFACPYFHSTPSSEPLDNKRHPPLATLWLDGCRSTCCRNSPGVRRIPVFGKLAFLFWTLLLFLNFGLDDVCIVQQITKREEHFFRSYLTNPKFKLFLKISSFTVVHLFLTYSYFSQESHFAMLLREHPSQIPR